MIILWLKLYYFFTIWSRTSSARQFTGEELNRGANTTLDAWLDIVAWGFWERQRSPFFNVRVCHLNADSYRDLDPDQIFRQHKTEKKCQYTSWVLEVEKASFTPLVFSTTGGMAVECKWYHTRPAELFATEKGKSYATTITFLHCTNYDWTHTVTLHNFQTLFNSRFRSWLVLNFLFHSGVKWTSNINNQALLFYFIQYSLLCSVLLSICILKSHSILLVDSYTGCGSWLLLVDSYTGCGSWLLSYWIHTCTLVVAHVIHVFVIPVITQHSTNKISSSESSAPSYLPYNINIAFEQVFCISIPYGKLPTSLSLPFYTLPAHFACQWSW